MYNMKIIQLNTFQVVILSFIFTAHSVPDHTCAVQQSPGSETKDASQPQINILRLIHIYICHCLPI